MSSDLYFNVSCSFGKTSVYLMGYLLLDIKKHNLRKLAIPILNISQKMKGYFRTFFSKLKSLKAKYLEIYFKWSFDALNRHAYSFIILTFKTQSSDVHGKHIKYFTTLK